MKAYLTIKNCGFDPEDDIDMVIRDVRKQVYKRKKQMLEEASCGNFRTACTLARNLETWELMLGELKKQKELVNME